MTKQLFRLATPAVRQRAIEAIKAADDFSMVQIKPETRNEEQSAKFHAICGDLAKSGLMWAGKVRSAVQWKVLLVSGHAVATKEEAEIIPGLENEFVNVRESTAQMSKKRGASLITYSLAFCDMNGVKLSEPKQE